MNADDVMRAAPVMPVVVIDEERHAAPMARALLAGGVRVIEVTLRTPAAPAAIAAIAREVPDAIVGAGTVLTAADLGAAIAAGARFALSPGATPALLSAAASAPIPFIPGIATSSELMAGIDAGFTHFKFFPAEQAGGAPAVKALGGPFADARFCPTGGIGPDQVSAYLSLANVLCVGGSWITPADKMRAGDWAGIEALARRACAFGARA